MFALLGHDSFVRRDAPTPASTAIRAAIPSARSRDATPGALFTPPNGIEAPPQSLSVLIVDADPQRREVVARSLAAAGATHLAEASSAQEARALARSGRPCDLAVVDLSLPDGDALDLVAELRALELRTVVLGGPEGAATAPDAFRAGALAYLLTSPSTAVGGPIIGREAAAPRQGARIAGVGNVSRDLSAREVQVLAHVADGRSNAEIGQELGLSALTVKSHLSRIGRKLGTGDRARMVALAMSARVLA